MQRNITVSEESLVALPHIVTRLRCPQLACCRLEYEVQKQGALSDCVESEDPQPTQYPLQGAPSEAALSPRLLGSPLT